MNKGLISVVIVLAYLTFMLVITVANGRKKKIAENAVSFFLAGRGVSAILLPLVMIAAVQSTFAFLGAPGMYYTHGVSFMVLVLSQVWVALMVLYFGNKIRKLAKKNGYLSIGDYFADRYDSPYMKVLASIISVVMTMVFLAMQYVGTARALAVLSGGAVPYNIAILIPVIFSLLYVIIGGAKGIVLLDAIQAIILLTGILVAAWVALRPVGGIQALFQNTAESIPALLSRPGPRGLYGNQYWIMQFIVLPFGIWLCPHVWRVSLMAKDEKALSRSAISIPVSQVLIYGFAAMFVGFAGHQLINPADVTAADNILPLMMTRHAHWLIVVFILAAAMSAGVSTMTAMLLVTSQIVSQDIILYGRKAKISDKQNILISRIIVLVMTMIASGIALNPPQTLVQVVQDVAYTGLAQLAPPFVAGLYWKGARKEGVIAGLTVGTIILFATRILRLSPFGWPGFMWAFAINIVLVVGVSLALKNRDNSRVEEKFFSAV
ncbi:MAG: sodium:solute symporter family protein [Treponema sp.]|nr:sodium:solute symporter family protein [Treponema sp.]